MTQGSGLIDRLRALLERAGPFVSLYLDTEAATEDGARQLQLRWRALRATAEQQGASEEALGALDGVVEGAHLRGDGLAAIAANGDVALRASLSAPVTNRVAAGSLPHLLPLLEWRQDNPRVGVVLCDRVQAAIHVLGGLAPDNETAVEGSEFPITKVKQGGTSQPRFQRRAENNWEGNARDVAIEVARVAGSEGLEAVVIAGDVRAIGFLQEHLEAGIDRVALEIESRPEVGLEEVSDELKRAVASYAAQTTEDLLARFREERGQQDLAVEGAEGTLEALRMAQVDTLLVARDLSGKSAWFSPSEPIQLALDRSALEDLGLEDLEEAGLEDAAVRSALMADARVRILPALGAEHAPREGIGALLRFRT